MRIAVKISKNAQLFFNHLLMHSVDQKMKKNNGQLEEIKETKQQKADTAK